MSIIDNYRLFLEARKSDNIEEKLNEYYKLLYTSDSNTSVSNELLDYIDLKTGAKTRDELFSKYILQNYKKEKYNSILYILEDAYLKLPEYLTDKGYKITCINEKLISNNNFALINKNFNSVSTNVENYDLLLGKDSIYTEEIIKSALNNKKDFAILLDQNKIKDGYNHLLETEDANVEIRHAKILNKKISVLKNRE